MGTDELQEAGQGVEGLLEGARQRGFRQGMSGALACLTALSTAWVEYRTMTDVPFYYGIFNNLKADLPAISIFVWKFYGAALWLLPLACGVCLAATFLRGDRRWTLVLNLAGFFSTMLWLVLLNVALRVPMMTLLGPRR